MSILKSNKKRWIAAAVAVLLTAGAVVLAVLYAKGYLRSNQIHTAEEFGLRTITSDVDQDGDGVDDYTDIMLGARDYIATQPVYKSVYYENGGYPTDHYGVCTDVIWNAFMAAGYTLKDLVDEDIEANRSAYPEISEPDPNIDFRRVKNLKVFFDRNATVLTTDLKDLESWQPGDIVVFTSHIAIVSDRRNAKGYPFIIHHGPGGAREKNEIENYTIVGHYRWDGVKEEE
jgi:hypothetical protein